MKLSLSRFRKIIIYAIAFIISTDGFGNTSTVYILADQANPYDFEAYVNIKGGVTLTEHLAKKIVNEAREVELVNLSFDAQSSFLSSPAAEAIQKFKTVVNLKNTSDWSINSRKIIYDAHFRLVGLLNDEKEVLKYLQEAYCFDSNLAPPDEILSPEINKKFEQIKNNTAQSLVNWDQVNADLIIINGKQFRKNQSTLLCNNTKYRVTALSVKSGIISASLQTLPLKVKDGVVVADGTCAKPTVNKKTLEDLKQSFPQVKVDSLTTFYNPKCVVKVTDVIAPKTENMNTLAKDLRIKSDPISPTSDKNNFDNLMQPNAQHSDIEQKSWLRRNWYWVGLGVFATVFIANEATARSQRDDTDGF